jgi:type IV pilus assembly protein PilQ
LVDVSVIEALNYIVQDNNLILKNLGNIYRISYLPDPPVPPKKWNISYESGQISFDLQNEDIRETLNHISRETGITIMMDRSVRGNISGLVKSLPFEEALFHLLKNYGFYFNKEGLVYQVRRIGRPIDATSSSEDHFWINLHNNLLDLELNNAPIPQILDEVSHQMKISIFQYGPLNGTINARADNLTLDQCLNLILSSHEYTYKKSNGIYLVGPKDNKLLVSSRLIKLDHLKVDGIIEMLPEKLIEKADYKIIKEHNAILINGSQDIIVEIEDIIYQLDRPIPQILIDVLVVDYNYQDIREISVEAGLTGGISDSNHSSADKWFPEVDISVGGKTVNKYLNKVSNYFGITNIGQLPDDFYLTVKALEKTGKANIRSKPQIATLNGYPADITIGQTQYYILKTQTPIRDPSQVYIQETQQFKTIEANITVKITPWVSASGEITVEIHPEFNNPVGQFTAEIPPTIQRRALNSTVRLQDGETILLGGLIQSAETETISKFPILGNLPLIGRLFQNKNHQTTKSELIIYVTPHLSYGDELSIDG